MKSERSNVIARGTRSVVLKAGGLQDPDLLHANHVDHLSAGDNGPLWGDRRRCRKADFRRVGSNTYDETE